MANIASAPERRLARWRRKLRQEGLSSILARRWRWYKNRLMMDNPLVGRLVEACGNRVRLHGLDLSVDNPLITRAQKSTIYFGIYELGEIELIGRVLDRSRPTVELGGSIGVVACLTNRRLEHPDQHVVVEANPQLAPTLRHNAELNGCRFEVVEAAVAHGVKSIDFHVSACFLTGSLQAEGRTVSVPAVTLGEIIQRRGFEAINLVVDIEGAELGVVQHEGEVLRDHVALLIMETHPDLVGEGLNTQMLDTLGRLGFEERERYGAVVALVNQAFSNAPAPGVIAAESGAS